MYLPTSSRIGALGLLLVLIVGFGLIGNLGGVDLFINYTSGSGGSDGFAFFTSVPEPGSAIVLLGLGVVSCRRRAA